MRIYESKEELLKKLDERGNSDNSKYLAIVKDIIANICYYLIAPASSSMKPCPSSSLPYTLATASR